MGQLKTEDQWQRYASMQAIEAARGIATSGTTMPAGTPVGKLSDAEWGWLFSASLYAWLCARAEQATAEGADVEAATQRTNVILNPWDAGAIKTILPRLANMNIDWEKPLVAWSQETMIAFLSTAFELMRTAMAARDRGGGAVPKYDIAVDRIHRVAREVNAASGGPLAVGSELNDLEIPF
jgi:hypothetical protein